MAYGCTITVEASKITGSVSGLVWLITEDNLPSAAIDGGAQSVLNGGGNLRCYTDSSKATQLPIHVVSFVAGGTPKVQVWGRSASLSVGGTVYVEADSVATVQPLPSDTYGQYAVYTDYLYASLNGGKTEASADYGISGSGSDVAGRLPSLSATSSPRYVLDDASVGDTIADYTISIWHNGTGSGTFLCRREDSTTQYQVGISSDDSYFYQDSSGSTTKLTSPLAGWHKVDFVVSSNTVSAYADGVLSSSVAISKQSRPTIPLRVGYRGSGVSFAYSGVVGENCISSVAKDGDYIEAEYNNQSSPETFWSTSAWVDSGGGPTFKPFWIKRNKIL